MRENDTNLTALKSGMWYTASNFLVKSIGFLTVPLFSRLLTHEEFGLFNNFTSWLSILSIIVTMNLGASFISARYDFEKKFDEYILSVLILSSVVSAASAFLLNICFGLFAESFGLGRFYLNCIFLYLFFLPAVEMFQARERYFFRYKLSVAISLIVSLGTAAVSVLFVYLFRDKLEGRILGFIVPTILVGMVLYALIVKNGKRITTKYWKYAIVICLPFIPHMLSMTFLNQVDRIMITRICGAADNALYSLAYSCGAIISVLVTSLNTAFSPWLGQKLHEKKYDEINSFSRKYILLFFGLAVGIMVFAPEILLIMGGRSYYGSLYVMPPVACGCICQFLYTMFVNVEQFSKKTIGMAFASSSAALLNYVLNLIFIPRYGFVAAAYTTLVGFLWLLIVHMWLVKKYGFQMVYPYRFIIAAVIAALLLTLGINVLYHFTAVRILSGVVYLIVVGVVLYRKKDTVLKFIKRER